MKNKMTLLPVSVPSDKFLFITKCQFRHHLLQEAFLPGRTELSLLSVFTAWFMQGFLTCLAGAGRQVYLCGLKSKPLQGSECVPPFLASSATSPGLMRS